MSNGNITEVSQKKPQTRSRLKSSLVVAGIIVIVILIFFIFNFATKRSLLEISTWDYPSAKWYNTKNILVYVDKNSIKLTDFSNIRFSKTKNIASCNEASGTAVSPQDKYAAVICGSAIAIVNLENNLFEQINTSASEVEWLSDNELLYLDSNSIYQIDIVNKEKNKLVDGVGKFMISPDKKKIAYLEGEIQDNQKQSSAQKQSSTRANGQSLFSFYFYNITSQEKIDIGEIQTRDTRYNNIILYGHDFVWSPDSQDIYFVGLNDDLVKYSIEDNTKISQIQGNEIMGWYDDENIILLNVKNRNNQYANGYFLYNMSTNNIIEKKYGDSQMGTLSDFGISYNKKLIFLYGYYFSLAHSNRFVVWKEN